MKNNTEKRDFLIEKCKTELTSLDNPEKIEKELENVEKYVKNITKDKLIIRHKGDFLEGYSFLARELVVRF